MASRPTTLTTTDSPSTEARARNGGTSAPGSGSVWDVVPEPPAIEDVVTTSDTTDARIGSTPEHARGAPTEHPADPPRVSEPLIGATAAAPAPPADPPRVSEPLIGATAAAPASPRTTATRPRRVLSVRPGLALVAVIPLAAVVLWLLVLRDGSDADEVPVGSLAPAASSPIADRAVPEATDLTRAVSAPLAAPNPTAPPMTAAPPTTAVALPTSAPAPTTTVAPTTTAPAPTTTAPAPTTTTAAAPVVEPPPATLGPAIAVATRVEPCKFGNDCLVAGFSLTGFSNQPDAFVCEFADGSRYMIPLAHMHVDYACATGSRGDSITIEIFGVRSETAVHG